MTPLIARTDTPGLLARAASLCADSVALGADLVEVCAESRVLIQRGRDRRFTSTYSLLRAIHGGSDSSADVGLVTETIAGAFLCVQCIARKTGLQPVAVNDHLRAIARFVRLTIGTRRCDGCLHSTATFCVISNNGQASNN